MRIESWDDTMSPNLRVDVLGSDPRINDSDVVILFGEGPWEGWETTFLTPNSYSMPLCAPAYLVDGMTRDPQELADYTWMQVSHFPELWSRWCAAAGYSGLQPKRYFEVNNGAMAREAALSGMGIWMAGGRAGAPLDPDFAAGNLVLAHAFHAYMFQFGFYLACRSQSLGNPLVPAFREWMLAHYGVLSPAKNA